MMQISIFFSLLGLLSSVAAQEVTLSGTNTVSPTLTAGDYATSGVTYADGSTVTFATTADFTTATDLSSIVSAVNATTTANSTTATATYLVGGTQTTTSLNGTVSRTGTSTSSSIQPTNTVPCNGHPSFCGRKYSNISMVAAHNSPFTRPGNVASNQMLDVETQLNDGVRMLQFQTHLENGTIYLCHTSCDLLNAGTLEDYLTTVATWLDNNPYDVVTILMGNYDVIAPGNYTAPVRSSGLLEYVYTAPKRPMALDDWPTLGEMIITNRRAVVMLDYEANQEEIPWLLDEFSYMWETPFSPTDREFPCTAQRPPDEEDELYQTRMYIANHNLNLEIAFAGMSIVVPASNLLNETNAVSGYGSAGRAVSNCTSDWNRPPNFLLVDFYNIGNFNGSVFQVTSDANGVSYDRDSCCGTDQRDINGGNTLRPVNTLAAVVLLLVSCLFL